ncbi:MAG: thiamine diphosphokinase [Calditrichaeota bacterium]|nr:thiamine diphosphokinase [Calditrichota bacterium]
MSTDKSKSLLLFANGEVTSAEIERIRKLNFDQIVAADGGATNALKFGILPDVVIGDLDSITPEIREKLPDAQLLHRPSQEINDLHKALDFCVDSGAVSVTVLGITGKRFDHSLNNFSVLCHFDQQLNLQIFDANSQIFIVRDKWTFTGKPGQTVSQIPLGAVAGVTTAGLQWELRNETLAMGVREGCSNVFREAHVRVSIESGILLVFVNE